ncbi:MAG: flagellar hook-basal body complex protein FliE [Gammaproteobacteria bacterium]
MSDMNISQVLEQMRNLSIEAANKPEKTGHSNEFSVMLKQSIDKVNEYQRTAIDMARAFETGETDASLAEVMVSLQKADVSFQAMVQVRNKLVEAYKDIMNMPM